MQIAKLGNPFFQLPEPKEILYGDVKIGQTFIWKGESYRKTPFGRQSMKGGRPGKHLEELTIVEI